MLKYFVNKYFSIKSRNHPKGWAS